MATTLETVLEYALANTDNLDEKGKYITSDNAEYRHRTLQIANMLIGELYPFSDTYAVTKAGKRPVVTALTSFDDEIDLDDYICRTVLPYGLAAELFKSEDPDQAGYCLQRYQELKAELRKGVPSVAEPIVDVYGGGFYDDDGNWQNGFEYNNFGRW